MLHPTRCNTKKGTGLRRCLPPRTCRTIGIRPLLRGLPTQLSQCHWPRAAVVRQGHDTSVTQSACHEVPGHCPARHRLVIKLGPWRMRMKPTVGSSEGEISRLGHHVLSHLSRCSTGLAGGPAPVHTFLSGLLSGMDFWYVCTMHCASGFHS